MPATDLLSVRPHRRYNPLLREWLLVSPHRTQRPWQGQVEAPTPETRSAFDPGCYLCPGNVRANGSRNPDYSGTYVFTNDFPALLLDTEEGEFHQGELFQARAERGTSRVVCFSPRHDLTLARMEPAAIRAVVDAWAEQYDELAANFAIHHIEVFENRGAMMGASNPHPHGQIWAQSSIPSLPQRELDSLAEYRMAHGGASLLADYAAQEEAARERLVLANDHFVVVVPFWAVWPFETLLISREPVGTISDLADAGRDALADAIRRLTIRYDNVFKTSFPYSMGFHQAPTAGAQRVVAHLHAHYYPPLLRSATVRKFMVGYEMLAEPQRDITPESAAQRLREVGETHFTELTR